MSIKNAYHGGNPHPGLTLRCALVAVLSAGSQLHAAVAAPIVADAFELDVHAQAPACPVTVTVTPKAVTHTATITGTTLTKVGTGATTVTHTTAPRTITVTDRKAVAEPHTITVTDKTGTKTVKVAVTTTGTTTVTRTPVVTLPVQVVTVGEVTVIHHETESETVEGSTYIVTALRTMTDRQDTVPATRFTTVPATTRYTPGVVVVGQPPVQRTSTNWTTVTVYDPRFKRDLEGRANKASKSSKLAGAKCLQTVTSHAKTPTKTVTIHKPGATHIVTVLHTVVSTKSITPTVTFTTTVPVTQNVLVGGGTHTVTFIQLKTKTKMKTETESLGPTTVSPSTTVTAGMETSFVTDHLTVTQDETKTRDITTLVRPTPPTVTATTIKTVRTGATTKTTGAVTSTRRPTTLQVVDNEATTVHLPSPGRFVVTNECSDAQAYMDDTALPLNSGQILWIAKPTYVFTVPNLSREDGWRFCIRGSYAEDLKCVPSGGSIIYAPQDHQQRVLYCLPPGSTPVA